MTKTPHSAPDDTTLTTPQDNSAEPTTVLAAETTLLPSDVPASSASSDGTTAAATAPQNPELQHQLDQEAALKSLDETILRPIATPIDFEPQRQGPSADARGLTLGSTGTAFPWKRAGFAAGMVAVALAVAIRVQGSRQTHVGLFGMPQPTEQEDTGADPTVPITATAETPDEPTYEEELEEEEPVEEVSDEASSDDADQPDEERDMQGPPSWGYTTSWPDESSDSPNDYEDYPTSEEELSRQHTFTWNLDDTWHSEGNDQNGTQSTPTLNDDRSFSYTFDGGSVTYYYDDNTLTLDADALDELEQHMDEYDVWRYMFGDDYSSGGYGSGQEPTSHRRRGW